MSDLPTTQTSTDYNRGASGLARRRGFWLVAGACCAALISVTVPFDGTISRFATSLRVSGDFRRELEVVQQYGAATSLILTASLVWLLDRQRRRRLLDLLAAIAVAGVSVTVAKMLVGRPRPKFADPMTFSGPFRAYPLDDDRGMTYAWEFWRPIRAELWSMPSSHTAYAVALSVFLVALYPRLRPLAVGMPILVGACRVLFGAHYLSDVFAGACVGFVAASPAVRGYWGVRALDVIWRTFVNRAAVPSYPKIAEPRQAG